MVSRSWGQDVAPHEHNVRKSACLAAQGIRSANITAPEVAARIRGQFVTQIFAPRSQLIAQLVWGDDLLLKSGLDDAEECITEASACELQTKDSAAAGKTL